MKVSRNAGTAFTRIHFKMKRGEGDYFWAKTDIVPTFRNYANWKPFLKVGTIVGDLILKKDNTVDADSKPTPFLGKDTTAEEEKVEEITKEEPPIQNTLL